MARVVLLTNDGASGALAAAYLWRRFPDLAVIVEAPQSRREFLMRRLRRLGARTVLGQLLFMALQRVQRKRSRARIAALSAGIAGDAEPPRIFVPSVNAPECLARLRALKPEVVLVMGTRLIGAGLLSEVGAPVVNYHAGVTPKYRGVHGGYWALAENDAGNFGVTVHLIDAGIDTGAVLYQARVTPDASDNFSTYPYLQLGAGLPLLAKAAEDALAGQLTASNAAGPSRLWSHPTVWQYIATGWRRGVW